ncbi:hypothetical protein [Campylobacter jejuni]|uniref:hypothetical protein n=1 Tax=Campylobacter jejuni TaxID=197 RepID=UPI000F8137D1|nr:hypothetical protein [Campylobacter jejuni]RTI71112.1 hypothetical protein C3I15_08615 [Campylobacter jejuni]
MSVDMSSKIDELAHNIGEVINRADALMDKFEKNEGGIAGIEESLKNKAVLLTQNLEWTVGTGGKFADLQSALNESAKYQNLNERTIKIILKRGYIITPIRCVNMNLSFVSLESEDIEVMCNGNIELYGGSAFRINTTIKASNAMSSIIFDNANNVILGSDAKPSGFKNFRNIAIINNNKVSFSNFTIETSNIVNANYLVKVNLNSNQSVSFVKSTISVITNGNYVNFDGIVAVGVPFLFVDNLTTINITNNSVNPINAIRIYYGNAQIIGKINLTGKCSIGIYRLGRLQIDEAIIKSTNNSEILFKVISGGIISFSRKPTITHTGTKCNIPYGQITADGSFCQNLE